MNLNLRKASALIKDLQYSIIPSLIQNTTSATAYSISTLVTVDIGKAVNVGQEHFNTQLVLMEKALDVLAQLRALVQEANVSSGINTLVSTLTAKQNLLKAYEAIASSRNIRNYRSPEELKTLYSRACHKDSYQDSINGIVKVDLDEKIEQLKKEIKVIKDEKLLGANFHNSIEITDEMKSTLEELKAI